MGRVFTIIFSTCIPLFIIFGCSGPSDQKPNIILFLADDLGYGELGCYGQKIIHTPNIDRIASEGMRFIQFYSGSPVCAPSRCVLLTGKHTGHAFIRDNGNPKDRSYDPDKGIFPGQHPIPDSVITIAELLKNKGYATAAIGKWGLGFEGSSGDPNKQGFDFFYGYLCQIHAHNHYPRFLWKNGKQEILTGNTRSLTGKQYSQDLFTRESVKFIQDNKDKPFFLYLAYIIPHLSIQAPEESLIEYKDKIEEETYEHHGYLKHPFPRAGYAAMVSHMDRDVGKIIALLKELDIDKHTLIIFTSDNGPTYNRLGGSDSEFFHSARAFRGLKGSLYEGGIRVPFIVRWPGHIPAGSVSGHISAFWDILPTLCEITGVDLPINGDGISLVPTLLGREKQPTHEYLYWEFPSYDGQQALRMGDWKGVRQNIFKDSMDIELYNLATDISEKKDVSKEYPQIIEKIDLLMKEARVPSALFRFEQLDSID